MRSRSTLLYRGRQQGIVLVVALIMLAVVAITSTTAMRVALSGDLISGNLRSGNLADQASEAALRWCEAQLMVNPVVIPVVPIAAGPAQAWSQAATWTGGNVINVPAAVLAPINGANRYAAVLPQCVVERIDLPTRNMDDANAMATKQMYATFMVTTRAFSPGYSRTANSTAGGETWAQSVMYIPISQE